MARPRVAQCSICAVAERCAFADSAFARAISLSETLTGTAIRLLRVAFHYHIGSILLPEGLSQRSERLLDEATQLSHHATAEDQHADDEDQPLDDGEPVAELRQGVLEHDQDEGAHHRPEDRP